MDASLMGWNKWQACSGLRDGPLYNKLDLITGIPFQDPGFTAHGFATALDAN